MPQLDFAYWPGQILWLLITFGVLYFVLARVLLPRVGQTLASRRARIFDDMAEARRLRDEAEASAESVHAQMAEARAQAQRTAVEAKARAAADALARQATLEAELAGKLAEAETRIRATRDQEMAQVGAIAADTAAAMTAKVSGEAVAAGEVERAVGAVSARGAAG